jgi:ParB family chromosome partitioning protein
MEVEVASIIEGDNGRSDYGSTETLRQLGESLRVRQLQNVWITEAKVLVIGYRRYRAAKLVGLKTLRATVTDEKLTPSEIRLIQLTEDMFRQDWKAADRWRACVELMKLNPGWQNKDLAAHLKVDAGTVTRLLSPSKCIPAVQEAFEAGRLSFSDTTAIAKADSEAEQHDMLKAKLSGASRDDLEDRVKGRRKSSRPVLVRVPIPLASDLSVTVAGKDLSLKGVAKALKDAMKAVREGERDNQSVPTFVRARADKVKGGEGNG